MATHHRSLKVKRQRIAAIAYLDADAPTLLPLRGGDLLVVNAARAALRAHATSRAALSHSLKARVRVLSTPNLHTSAIVTQRQAIVGSAGASQSSPIADEAVIITDDPGAVTAARRFIDGLDEDH